MSTPLRSRRDGGTGADGLVPPHSVEAEQSVLGALLIDGRAWDQVADVVQAGDFYRPDHRLIFEALAELVASGRPGDVVTVSEQLERRGNSYIFSAMKFGQPHVQREIDGIELGDEIYVGLFLCAHDADVLERAVFNDVRVENAAKRISKEER